MSIKTEITRLLDAYPNFTPRNPAGTIETYIANLEDIPEWLLAKAVTEHIKTSKFFPSVSELRDLATKLHGSNYLEGAQPDAKIPEWSTDVYWEAMSLFNDSLAGEITEESLRRNVNWIACERRKVDI